MRTLCNVWLCLWQVAASADSGGVPGVMLRSWRWRRSCRLIVLWFMNRTGAVAARGAIPCSGRRTSREMMGRVSHAQVFSRRLGNGKLSLRDDDERRNKYRCFQARESENRYVFAFSRFTWPKCDWEFECFHNWLKCNICSEFLLWNFVDVSIQRAN